MKLLKATALVVFTVLFGCSLFFSSVMLIVTVTSSPLIFLTSLIILGTGKGYDLIAIWLLYIFVIPCILLFIGPKLWRRVNHYYFAAIVSNDFGGPVRYGTVSYGILTGREKLLSVTLGIALAMPLVYFAVKYYPYGQ